MEFTDTMPETIEQPTALDAAEFIKTRNLADAARRAGNEPPSPTPGKPKEEAKPVVADDDHLVSDDADEPGEQHTGRRSVRSLKRELSNQRKAAQTAAEEAAELRGRLKAIEEFGLPKKPVQPETESSRAKGEDDPEPQRKDFPEGATGDSAYWRAIGKWEGKQGAKDVIADADKKALSEKQLQQLREAIADADKKATTDQKLIKDWDEVAAAAAKDPEQPTFDGNEHPYLMRRIAVSDVKAFVLHHLAKNPADFKKLLSLTEDLDKQAQFFSRLEGRVEKMYSTEDPKIVSEAAEASEKPEGDSQDRLHLAEGVKPGRTASERDALKPRPSTEVAARGGSAPPDDPPIGSKAWMERRNAETRGR